MSELFCLVFELWCHYSSSNVQLLFLWKYLTSCSCLFIHCSSIYAFKYVTSYFEFSIFSHFSSYVIVFLSMVHPLCYHALSFPRFYVLRRTSAWSLPSTMQADEAKKRQMFLQRHLLCYEKLMQELLVIFQIEMLSLCGAVNIMFALIIK